MGRRRKWRKPDEIEKKVKKQLLSANPDPSYVEAFNLLKPAELRILKNIRLRPGPGKAFPHKAGCGCARCTKQNPRLYTRKES